jgi:exodeoxyribonuclease VII small subunit
MQDTAEQAIAGLSFEDALKRLETIVHRLESGDASLEEAITLYGEGDRLRQQCETRLKAAEARIEKIVAGADGQAAGVRPFDEA